MRDRIAAGLDYEVNLKAEIEIIVLHEKLDQIRVGHLAELMGELQEQVRGDGNDQRDRGLKHCPYFDRPAWITLRSNLRQGGLAERAAPRDCRDLAGVSRGRSVLLPIVLLAGLVLLAIAGRRSGRRRRCHLDSADFGSRYGAVRRFDRGPRLGGLITEGLSRGGRIERGCRSAPAIVSPKKRLQYRAIEQCA
jgi:hypothetical protein